MLAGSAARCVPSPSPSSPLAEEKTSRRQMLPVPRDTAGSRTSHWRSTGPPKRPQLLVQRVRVARCLVGEQVDISVWNACHVNHGPTSTLVRHESSDSFRAAPVAATTSVANSADRPPFRPSRSSGASSSISAEPGQEELSSQSPRSESDDARSDTAQDRTLGERSIDQPGRTAIGSYGGRHGP